LISYNLKEVAQKRFIQLPHFLKLQPSSYPISFKIFRFIGSTCIHVCFWLHKTFKALNKTMCSKIHIGEKTRSL